jgi:hypothetical protein
MSTQTAVARVQQAAANTQPDTPVDTLDIASDRLEGAEAIRDFIKPGMAMRTARRLLEDGIWPCWREGRLYVASKAALREHWRQKTRGFKPRIQKKPEAATDTTEAA